MPPLVNEELPDGRVERTLTVGLLPADGAADARHEIVGVTMIRRQVERYSDGAPAGARAAEQLCGAPSANQSTTGRGVPGQAKITVLKGSTRLWSLVAVRPSASSGTDGSGVELRSVYYRGKPVMHQAHVPVLNVRYQNNQCGPYRDWQWEEGMFQARGRNPARAFRLCSEPARTILDTGSDFGNFRGVAVYVAGQEVVLVSEMEAGWYRYVSEWRLHADGTIRPRFGFDAIDNSCVCLRHFHHVYWRFDFTVETSGNNLIFEHSDPPLQPGTNVWQPQPFEARRLRDAARKRRWRVHDHPRDQRRHGQGRRLRQGGRVAAALPAWPDRRPPAGRRHRDPDRQVPDQGVHPQAGRGRLVRGPFHPRRQPGGRRGRARPHRRPRPRAARLVGGPAPA
jgi:hypothetical protein